MSNEEKILEMLGNMQKDIKEIKSDIKELKTHQKEYEQQSCQIGKGSGS